MAGYGSKIFIFALILSFTFSLWAGTKVAGIDSGSITYNEVSEKIGNNGDFISRIIEVFKNNMATSAISAIGLVFGNPYLAFAAIALTIFNTFLFPQALLNEQSLGAIGTLLSNIISFLYGMAAITWFAGKGDF